MISGVDSCELEWMPLACSIKFIIQMSLCADKPEYIIF